MRILFTGASSFTGYWFVRELARAGHDVTATFQRRLDAYDGVRQERVRGIAEACRRVDCYSFGDDGFLGLIREGGPWDALCHHAAYVTDYKSPGFDVHEATRRNTHRLTAVLDGLGAAGCKRIVLTGSVFESDEGAGGEGLEAFSPYGLSKALTAQVFRYYALAGGFCLGKFVIPNPFGPFEEPRFTSYLVRTWYGGKVASVNTPDYVRDNIHVSLLAKTYVHFVESMSHRFQRCRPSGYAASQGLFATTFAEALRHRLGLACELDLQRQTSFTEPRVRVNTDPVDVDALGWSEDGAWDELADYYRATFAPGRP